MIKKLKALFHKLVSLLFRRRDPFGYEDEIPEVGDPLPDTKTIPIVQYSKARPDGASGKTEEEGHDADIPQVEDPHRDTKTIPIVQYPEAEPDPQPTKKAWQEGHDDDIPKVGGPIDDTGAYRTLPRRQRPARSLLEWLRKTDWRPPEPSDERA